MSRTLPAIAVTLLLVAGVQACADDPSAPGDTRVLDGLGIALSVADPARTTLRAFDIADEARIRVTARESLLADTTITLAADETRLALELTLESGVSRLVVEVEVSGGGFLLFTGTETVEVGEAETRTVEVTLDPVLGELEPAMDVAAEAAFQAGGSCSLNVHGQLFCWGDHPGAQGDPDPTPVLVESEVRFAEVVGGAGHLCALTDGGEAHCWGSNGLGQLGDGTRTPRTSPTPVIGGLVFTSISPGLESTCGSTDDGSVYCWGRNDRDQLGRETAQACDGFPCDPAPGAVPGLAGAETADVGLRHACATGSGVALCWGSNTFSELGLAGDTATSVRQPRPVEIEVDLEDVRAGTLHSCGLDPSGTPWCWGAALPDGTPVFDLGQLGDGAFDGGLVPAPVSGGTAFVSLSLGGANNIFSPTTCGVSDEGTAHCWGSNFFGQLGTTGGETCTFNESFDCANTPTPVDTDAAFTSLSTSGVHTCGVTTEHTILCWGRNQEGQLGDGTTTDRGTPVRVGG